MSKLTERQQDIVKCEDNVFVTACPGSGKTRVLTFKVMRELERLESSKKRIIALTFTNRSAEEIKSRLQDNDVPTRQLWAGTIHAFALDWILRPYSCYIDCLRHGFSVVDELYSRMLIDTLKDKYNIKRFTEVRARFDRNGQLTNSDRTHCALLKEYYEQLADARLTDFDQILSLSVQLLKDLPSVAKTLGAIVEWIFIDEYQDTQDLQYAILSAVCRASSRRTRIFIVGDDSQAIYASRGGDSKTREEIQAEFGVNVLIHFFLEENFRSTQRIVDYCGEFQEPETPISSRAEHANERGLISFSNQDVFVDALPRYIKTIIQQHLDAGVPPEEICVLAPRWQFVTELGRRLVSELPDVELDAPGLSPFRRQQDNLWFKLARIFLTDPEPQRFRKRVLWASEFLMQLEQELGSELHVNLRSPRRVLKMCNESASLSENGVQYLQESIKTYLEKLGLSLLEYPSLQESMDSFFDTSVERLNDPDYQFPTDTAYLRRLYRHPNGVVLNTCQGAKGEEYDVVIVFGVLRGYVPHWHRIFDDAVDDADDARKIPDRHGLWGIEKGRAI